MPIVTTRPLFARILAHLALVTGLMLGFLSAPLYAESEPQQVKVGLYITQLGDIDIARQSFGAHFWAWYITQDDAYKPFESVEVVNSKNSITKFPSSVEKGGVVWSQASYTATLQQLWDIRNFPFDRQQLTLPLEDSLVDTSSVVFVADKANSAIDKAVKIPGWTIENFDIQAVDIEYDTSYGDPTLNGSSTFSRIIATVSIKRDGARLMFTVFLGFIVAFSLSFFSYCFDETDAMTRLCLGTPAIFAAVGNKYILDNLLPPVSYFTLADGVQLTTFGSIVLCIAMVPLLMRIAPKNPKRALTLNRLAATFSLLMFIGINGWSLTRALG